MSSSGKLITDVPPLAVVNYNPGSIATYTTSSNATLVDVDATNLITPAFTVPGSGNLLILLSASVVGPASAGSVWFAVRIGSTDYDPSTVNALASTSPWLYLTTFHYVTGLTAGSSVTAKWRWCSGNAAQVKMFAGGPALGTSGVGGAKMIVLAA